MRKEIKQLAYEIENLTIKQHKFEKEVNNLDKVMFKRFETSFINSIEWVLRQNDIHDVVLNSIEEDYVNLQKFKLPISKKTKS
jgi:hypothetical protein